MGKLFLDVLGLWCKYSMVTVLWISLIKQELNKFCAPSALSCLCVQWYILADDVFLKQQLQIPILCQLTGSRYIYDSIYTL